MFYGYLTTADAYTQSLQCMRCENYYRDVANSRTKHGNTICIGEAALCYRCYTWTIGEDWIGWAKPSRSKAQKKQTKKYFGY